jgi:cytosine permease
MVTGVNELQEREASSAQNGSGMNDYAVQAVPASERKSFLSIVWVNAGYTINLGTIFGGAALAAFLPLNQVFIALLISALLQIALSVPIGAIGAKYGLNSSLLARQSYGKNGAWLIAFSLAVSLGVGWFGWQVALFADTIHALAPGFFLTEKVVACIWGGALMILTATVGFKALSILSFIVVPMMLTFFAFGTVSAIAQSEVSFSQLMTQAPPEFGTLGTGITVAVGLTVAGCLGMADITRYAKTPKQAGISGTLGYLGGALFCQIAGALIYVVSGVLPTGTTPNLIEAMLKLGFGFGCLVMLIAAQWSTNDNNLYSGALGLANIFKIKRPVASVIMGTLGVSIAIAGIQDFFVPFLNILGLVLPPFGGIITSHHFILRPMLKLGYAAEIGDKMSKVNVLALTVTAIAAVASYFLADLAPGAIVGAVVAFVLYAFLGILLSKFGIKYTFGEYTLS